MANDIRIKRRSIGGASGAPSSLLQSELAYSEVDQVLYIGQGSGGGATVVAIAGPGAYLTSAVAGSTYLTQSNASSTYLSQSAAGSTYLPLTGGTISQNLTILGNLTINGTTTTVNSTTVAVADKNIELAKVENPTDSTADGAGLTVIGSTNHTWNWVDSTDAWTSSEHVNLASGKGYYINGTSVLSSSTLGSGVTASSLTGVGTLTSGAIGSGFTTIAVSQGGTGATTITGLVKGNGASAFTAAVAGTDYLSPSSEIDGGTF